MPEIKTELLFKIVLEVPSILDLGETPFGRRRIARVGGGTFEGPKMKGRVLDGGGDWLLLRRDGVLQLDVRQTLETDDKQHIYMTYRGYRHGPKDVIDRLNRGEAVDPSLYYFRTTPYFETGSEKYAWLNGICAVAAHPQRELAGERAARPAAHRRVEHVRALGGEAGVNLLHERAGVGRQVEIGGVLGDAFDQPILAERNRFDLRRSGQRGEDHLASGGDLTRRFNPLGAVGDVR